MAKRQCHFLSLPTALPSFYQNSVDVAPWTESFTKAFNETPQPSAPPLSARSTAWVNIQELTLANGSTLLPFAFPADSFYSVGLLWPCS